MSHVTGVGDYDYDDSHELPAGCQGLDVQTSESLGSTNNSVSVQQAALAGASVSGHVSAPAPAHHPAAMAPVQASAPGTNTGRRGAISTAPGYTAPASAPAGSPRDANVTSATLDALQSRSDVQQPGQVRLLCKPIAARGDQTSHTSTTRILYVVLDLTVSIMLIVLLLLTLCYSCKQKI